MPNMLIYFFIVLFGVIFGSFANVVILRDDKRSSILTGRSECPHCHHILAWFELIPLLSFILQGGKCRSCKKRISWQYPLVEIGMGGLFALAFYIAQQQWMVAVGFALSFFFLFIASVIDLRTKMIPVEYVLIAGFFGGVLHIIQGTGLVDILLGIVIGAGVLALVRLTWYFFMKEEGMGEGDLWLGGALGALTAYPLILATLVSAILLGALIGVIATALRKATLEYALPFGPFLFIGALIALLWGEELIRWYSTLSGLTIYG